MADLRSLPSVDRILREPAAQELAARAGRDVAVAARAPRRSTSGGAPAAVDGDRDATAAAIAAEALAREAPHLRPVLNATGVIVHTNLGRAPLAARGAGRGRRAWRPATRTSSSTWSRAGAARARTRWHR